MCVNEWDRRGQGAGRGAEEREGAAEGEGGAAEAVDGEVRTDRGQTISFQTWRTRVGFCNADQRTLKNSFLLTADRLFLSHHPQTTSDAGAATKAEGPEDLARKAAEADRIAAELLAEESKGGKGNKGGKVGWVG